MTRFPALRLARECLEAGRSAPTVLNGANEVAVAAYLNREIGFLDIAHVVETVLDEMGAETLGDIETVFSIDAEARARTVAVIATK